MYTTTITRINRYHFCEEIRYPGYDFSTCDLFLSPEWFEDFSKPIPVSFWEEVATPNSATSVGPGRFSPA